MEIIDIIQIAIENILLKHPEYKTKEGSKGECITASDLLLFEVDRLCNRVYNSRMHGESDYNGIKGQYHHWAVFNDSICVDLTARQFDENADCPKIWNI